MPVLSIVSLANVEERKSDDYAISETAVRTKCSLRHLERWREGYIVPRSGEADQNGVSAVVFLVRVHDNGRG